MKNNIRSERVKLGMTQEALAGEIGVVESTVREWENGNREPNGASLRIMSRLFRCTTDYLLGITEERLPASSMRV